MLSHYPAIAAALRDRIAELLSNFDRYDELDHAKAIAEQAEALVTAAEHATFDREWQYRKAGKTPKNSP
jgi:hypothetical protein